MCDDNADASVIHHNDDCITSNNDKNINMNDGNGKFHFSIDRGGTFTDLHCQLPNGTEIVSKLLSEDPSNYADAPTEGIRRILQEYDTKTGIDYARNLPVPTNHIGSIRMGTTVATNALLERKGARMALLITKGFKDLLEIGNQARPSIFDLTCFKPDLLYEEVIEIDERIILETFIEDCKEEETFIEDCREEEKKMDVSSPSSPTPSSSSRVGVTGEHVRIVKSPDLIKVESQLDVLRGQGITSIAICLMHSYVYPDHEVQVEKVAQSMGCFTQVSCSSQTMPMVKLVSRSHTACAAAYLTPMITTYLQSFTKGFDSNLLMNVPLTFMKSDGGLAPFDSFGGHQAILSGPAGGVVGYAKTSYSSEDPQPVIGFDMGGTSTDVSRYEGKWEHVFETTTAGVAIQAPQLDIRTVAAGGGSCLFLKRGMFVVGPESAGAHPGPVCYRKSGGLLAITDANLVLGRILPEEFPNIFGPSEDQPLDAEGSYKAFQQLMEENPIESQGRTVEELAYGFLKVANEAMCRPIRNLTQMRGYDITTHKLACFGGAGPQHACAVAKALGIKRVLVHRYGGILSAYGLSMADAVQEEQEPSAELYANCDGIENADALPIREERMARLAEKAKHALFEQGYSSDSIVIEKYLNLRFQGTDNAIMVCEPTTKNEGGKTLSYGDVFRSQYHHDFGFVFDNREIIIDDYRVRAVVPGQNPDKCQPVKSLGIPSPSRTTKAYFESGWELETPVYRFEMLQAGHQLHGPAIIVQEISTVILEIGCTANVTPEGDLDIVVESCHRDASAAILASSSATITIPGEDMIAPNSLDSTEEVEEDAVELSIFAHRFMGIAEQMGRTLQRTATSVNIKERLDFSCALFTKDGGLVANAPHVPVHLGAMQSAVKFQVQHWNSRGREGIQEGDVLVSNHPQLAGGSHLPDITVVTPVFHEGFIIFFVASRGHHADIGGIAPGSMPPHSQNLEEEGACIVAFKLVKNGQFQEQGITDILMSPGKIPGNSGTRNLRDNLSDLRAQVAANNSGIRLLADLVEEYSFAVVDSYMTFIQENAEDSVRTMLKDFAKCHGGRAHAIDHLDDGSPIELTVDIDIKTGNAIFDFTGTGPQVLGNINAPPAVTFSAVIYCLRSMVDQDIPLNEGCLAPIEFRIPKYTLLNPSVDAAVVGGNVLTSQRVVDVVLKAFKACAASQGCMNNLTFGDDRFGYYETIAGGAGAGPTWEGRSGIHTHCTNTRITDPEILERRYPVLLRQFALRPHSGGRGRHKGGDGVVREIEPLKPLVMSILSERRTLHPYGMEGGQDGACGRNLLIKKTGVVVNMGGKCSSRLNVGERLRIETPGGGGWGSEEEKEL